MSSLLTVITMNSYLISIILLINKNMLFKYALLIKNAVSIYKLARVPLIIASVLRILSAM